MKKLFIDKSKSTEHSGIALVTACCSICGGYKNNCAKSPIQETVSIPVYESVYSKWNFSYKHSLRRKDNLGNDMYNNRVINHIICVDCIKQLNTLMKSVKSEKLDSYSGQVGIGR